MLEVMLAVVVTSVQVMVVGWMIGSVVGWVVCNGKKK